jgi:cytochrome b6-f complex iron-sulfur subunit
MNATTIFVLAIIAAAVLVAAGVIAVAARRGADAGPITGDLDRRALRRDRVARAEQAKGETAVATMVEETEEGAADHVQPEPPPDPLAQREPLTSEEMGVTRRRFLNRSLVGIFGGVFLGGQALAFLAFLWPKLKGGFGAPVNVGKVEDLRAEILGDVITPSFKAAAQSWIVPFDPADLEGSSFDPEATGGVAVVAGGGAGEVGLMALWQRCVHLGCRVPECISSQGFECPCHGSKYNFHGEYFAGPAPRNMDRFAVLVNDAGDLIVDTGTVIQTARATTTTIEYPQGPQCV